MSMVWLAYCTREGYEALREEIVARDAAARVVRVDRANAVEDMVDAFAGMRGEVGVALGCPCGSEDALALTKELARHADVRQLLVVVDALDPAWIARLFQAGATEVIAGDARPPSSDEDTRERLEGTDAEAGPRVPPRDDGKMPQPRVDAPRSMPSTPASVSGGYAEDLDEPDEAPVREATPAPVESLVHKVRQRSGQRPTSASGAPLVVTLSGRGGTGVTTLVAAMAQAASSWGLRCAVLDLDLMFGNLYTLLGAEAPEDMVSLVAAARTGALAEEDIVRASVRVAPGVTLWGPVERPEYAELLGKPVEMLIDILRREADVIFVDTPRHMGDAAAAAVASCDRCLVVGDARTGSAPAACRAIGLAQRLGVPRTRMTSVFNRLTGQEGSESAASRFEFTTALGSKLRIAEGGAELDELSALGELTGIMAGSGAFAESVRQATRQILVELGCPVDAVACEEPAARAPVRKRLHLPWSHREVDDDERA